MLQVKNLSKSYVTKQGTLRALDDVSVEVAKGEIFGFIGLSGAGKTSLARCVSALEKADCGEILLSGVDITKQKGARLREIRKKMGLVFQHFNLLMNATVFENIAFPLRIAKIRREGKNKRLNRFLDAVGFPHPRRIVKKRKEEIDKRVNELLDIVGLTDKKHAYPATLSGGQKQRVGIARALATEPELVICDEATSALDPDTTRSILALIKRIGAETGVTFLVITHEMDVIKELCTHVAVMEDGKIIEQGPVLDVLTAPKTPTAKRFFSKDYVDTAWLGETYIYRAIFIGDAARKSFIHDVIRKFDIELSILSGNIEAVGGTMVGSLILEIVGEDKVLRDVQQYFHDNGVGIEELG